MTDLAMHWYQELEAKEGDALYNAWLAGYTVTPLRLYITAPLYIRA